MVGDGSEPGAGVVGADVRRARRMAESEIFILTGLITGAFLKAVINWMKKDDFYAGRMKSFIDFEQQPDGKFLVGRYFALDHGN